MMNKVARVSVGHFEAHRMDHAPAE